MLETPLLEVGIVDMRVDRAIHVVSNGNREVRRPGHYCREIRFGGSIFLLSPAAGLGGEGAAKAPPFTCDRFARSVTHGM